MTLWEPSPVTPGASPTRWRSSPTRRPPAPARAAEVVSYGQLARLAERFAGALTRTRRAARATWSASSCPTGGRCAALHLACVRIGAVANPIITDPPPREVGFILDTRRRRVCIVPGEFRGFDHAAMLAELAAELPSPRARLRLRRRPGGARGRSGSRRSSATPGGRTSIRRPSSTPAGRTRTTRAQLMFTSGTTGEPKGVLHSHDTMDVGIRAVSDPLGLGGDDVVLMFSPLGHQTGYLYGMCMPLKYGMKLVLQDVWDPVTMLRLVERRARHVDDGRHDVRRSTPAPRSAHGRTPTCRRCATSPAAGRRSRRKAVTEARAKLGTQLVAVWGMTEVGVCTITLPADPDETVCTSDGAPDRLGRAAHRRRRRRRRRAGRPTGRLLVRTAVAAPDVLRAARPLRGQRSRRGRRRLVRHRRPGPPDDRRLHPDHRPEQGPHHPGRGEHPVAEVEAGLITHPQVHEVAVVSYPDERLGETGLRRGRPRRRGRRRRSTELRAHLDGLGHGQTVLARAARDPGRPAQDGVGQDPEVRPAGGAGDSVTATSRPTASAGCATPCAASSCTSTATGSCG